MTLTTNPRSAEVKNNCLYTSDSPPPPYDFMVRTGMGYRVGSG